MKVYNGNGDIIFEHEAPVIALFREIDKNNSECIVYDEATQEELLSVDHAGPICTCKFNLIPGMLTGKTREEIKAETLNVKDVEWNVASQVEQELKKVK